MNNKRELSRRRKQMSRLKRIHVPVARYHSEEKLIEIEDDLAEVHWAYADMLRRRYAKMRRTDFTEEEEYKNLESKRDGVVGQRMFQALLNEWRVPYVHDDPCFEFREHRTFHDFVIPGFGSVEVKTYGRTDRYFVIKRELWQLEKEPDYVIALRLKSESIAKIGGWLHGYEVEKLVDYPSWVCPHAPCYACRFEELHDFKELEPKLKACSIKIMRWQG